MSPDLTYRGVSSIPSSHSSLGHILNELQTLREAQSLPRIRSPQLFCHPVLGGDRLSTATLLTNLTKTQKRRERRKRRKST